MAGINRGSKVAAVLAALLCVTGAYLLWFHSDRDIADIRQNRSPGMTAQLAAKSMQLGQPVFIRIFKETSELEVWVKNQQAYGLFKTYPICNYSGDLGPKLKEGDRQSPEGFYTVALNQLNPNSSYHLSFNLGFPNAYDRSLGRTGSYLMVHGNCVSIGCYAMTDRGIEEIYLLVESALRGGQQSVPVHAFPFRMTDTNMTRHAGSKWTSFWQNLKQGFDAFEHSNVPPSAQVRDGRYVFGGS